MSIQRIRLVLVIATLALSGMGCDVGQHAASTPTPVPSLVPTATVRPTPTPVPTLRAAAGAQASATPGPGPMSLAPAYQLQAQLEAVYQQAAPSVVNVTTEVIAYSRFMQAMPEQGTGSGFVYDTAGHIVTNYHVVQDAQSVMVSLANGSVYTATVVGQDPSTDLAVLTIPAADLPPPLALQDSTQLKVGQIVLAIGSPFALQSTLTMGIISALQRVIQSPDGTFIAQAIQTDAPINPGNSGGPLLNLDGELVGVNSQIVDVTGASVGIGFAIASNTVRQVVPVLIAQGHYPHPTLGVSTLDITTQVAEVLQQLGMDVPVNRGLLVIDVAAGGPAEAAGIRGPQQTVRAGRTLVDIGGDIITAINGVALTGEQDLSVYLESSTKIGDQVQVTLYRNGQQMTVTVTLGERPQQTPTP
jgi:S1-C subfamily serine protease